MPIPLSHPLKKGTLLLATDGLWKYADPKTLCAIARGGNLEKAARELAAAVRPASGRLPDDLALILARWNMR